MKRLLATISAIATATVPAWSHQANAGHAGKEGLLPHLHLDAGDVLYALIVFGLGVALYKVLKSKGFGRDSR